MNYRVPWVAPGLVVLTCVLGLLHHDRAGAQPPAPRPERPDYVRLPLGGDMEGRLKEMLGQSQDNQELKQEIQKLLQKILEEAKKNPGKFKLDPDQFKGWDKKKIAEWKNKIARNPLIQQQLEDWLDRPDLKNKFDPRQVDALQQKLLDEIKSRPPNGPPPQGKLQLPPGPPPGQLAPMPPGQEAPVPPVANPPPGAAAPDDALGDWAKDFLQSLEHSGLKDLVLESDAIQQALVDLDSVVPGSDQNPLGIKGDDLGKWLGDLHPPDWDGSLPKLPDWKLGSWSPPAPPALQPPTSSWAPSLPGAGPALGAPAVAGVGPVLLVFFVVVLAGVVAWLIWKAAPWNPLRSRLAAAWQPGPWPVDPSRLSTPGELILAFNYLSLLRFGPNAASWNHSTAAEHLGPREQPMSHQAAGRLAGLYEQARYAPGADTLSPEDVRQARQDLSSLAGGAG